MQNSDWKESLQPHSLYILCRLICSVVRVFSRKVFERYKGSTKALSNSAKHQNLQLPFRNLAKYRRKGKPPAPSHYTYLSAYFEWFLVLALEGALAVQRFHYGTIYNWKSTVKTSHGALQSCKIPTEMKTSSSHSLYILCRLIWSDVRDWRCKDWTMDYQPTSESLLGRHNIEHMNLIDEKELQTQTGTGRKESIPKGIGHCCLSIGRFHTNETFQSMLELNGVEWCKIPTERKPCSFHSLHILCRLCWSVVRVYPGKSLSDAKVWLRHYPSLQETKISSFHSGILHNTDGRKTSSSQSQYILYQFYFQCFWSFSWKVLWRCKGMTTE
jgi:hypothetical protein